MLLCRVASGDNWRISSLPSMRANLVKWLDDLALEQLPLHHGAGGTSSAAGYGLVTCSVWFTLGQSAQSLSPVRNDSCPVSCDGWVGPLIHKLTPIRRSKKKSAI